MNRANPFISNGTCYHSAGDKVDEWLPCGNAELGDKTCCQRGDLCLSSRACYNGRFGITYLAGCSDPEYAHESCPDKGPWSGQPWSGLVYCNGTSNEWVGCEQAARPTTLTSADACWCPQTSRTVAFADASVLENVSDTARYSTDLDASDTSGDVTNAGRYLGDVANCRPASDESSPVSSAYRYGSGPKQ
ncbi:hypothetical protein CTRI78_v001475 [Colletotrichum trifolii]|uniref:Uncharacterized protein n=1 Tax=Colletotrichum trifolii TaxID=5466 RepID=A0A4R8RPU4_COLTR|nr:hypothetical protein CTRI78_v001475 [Colletotrichum trifolii]